MTRKKFVLTVAFLMSTTTAFAQEGLKVYISADMEGVAGVVTGEQLGPSGFEYSRFRQFMTDEVLAAVEGARNAGATEILISDSHGNGQNIFIEQIPSDITVVRSWPRPLGMMQGIDETFDAAIFIGYHAGTTNPRGVRAHTMSSALLADIRLNGSSMLEAGINAAIAGHFGVPVVMISGDDATIAEAQDLLGKIDGAIVKWNYGFHSARTMTPQASVELIRNTVERALEQLDDYEPFVLETPITLDVRFKNYRPGEVLSYLNVVDRIDSHSIRFIGEDMIEVEGFLAFMMNYEAGLEP